MFSLNSIKTKYIFYIVIIIILIIILFNTFLTKLNNNYNNKIFENNTYNVENNNKIIEGLTGSKSSTPQNKITLWGEGIQFNTTMCSSDASVNQINNDLEMFTNGNALSIFNNLYNQMNSYDNMDKYFKSSDYKTFKQNIEFLKELNILHESINKFDVDCGNINDINNKSSISSKSSSFFSKF